METTNPLFPGDKAPVNLPNHLLYGKEGYVRFPYLCSFYKTQNGAIIIRRDGTSFRLYCWFGDVMSGKGELMVEAGLRDRIYDGTRWANDSALNPDPVDDPKANPRISPDTDSVELSVYCFMPRSDLADYTNDPVLSFFVKNPFHFIDKPEVFLTYLHKVLCHHRSRAPGQYKAPIPTWSMMVLPALQNLARRAGYDYIEACPSHYHVARWFESYGFEYLIDSQKETLQAFRSGIEELKKQGVQISRPEESWLCVAQNLASEFIPENWRLNNPICVWPQDCIHQSYLWMYKPLN